MKFSTLTLGEMVQIGARLRNLKTGTTCLEDVATGACQYLYRNLSGDQNQRACPLVRFFITHPYGQLPLDLQDFARAALHDVEEPSLGMRCLVLLGTAGDLPEWNSRAHSNGHKAIPLVSEEAVKSFPMISNLANQFGLEGKNLIHPSPDFFLDQAGRSFNVFYVPTALDSPLIPAQQNFVVPHNIQSVIGFGGPLPSGDIFAMILFTRIVLSHDIAELFKPVSLSLKLAAIEHSDRIFA